MTPARVRLLKKVLIRDKLGTEKVPFCTTVLLPLIDAIPDLDDWALQYGGSSLNASAVSVDTLTLLG